MSANIKLVNAFETFIMISWLRIASFLATLPALLKGAKFGKNSYIAPGYDFIFVRLKGLHVGHDVRIGRRAWIQTEGAGNIHIGDGTQIGRDATISSAGRISIGKKCLFSFRTSLLDHDHNFAWPDVMASGITHPEDITIGDGCFIGAQSFILKGVTLGERCLVGANSVVTRSFPSDTIIGGNPAREIGKRVYQHPPG